LRLYRWDSEQQKLILKEEKRGHRAEVTSVQTLPARSLVFTGAKDSSVFSWNTASWTPGRHLVGHRDQIADLTVNCTGDTLVTASWDQTLRAYSIADIFA
jgi:WD40 repeat protein